MYDTIIISKRSIPEDMDYFILEDLDQLLGTLNPHYLQQPNVVDSFIDDGDTIIISIRWEG